MKTIKLNGTEYDLITLDFETFYSKEYTLSGSMNTSEYVRDPRFHIHGVAIKRGEEPAQWFTTEQVKDVLASIDWPRTALIAHNTPFDGFIISEHFGYHPGLYIDTLSMARAAHGHHTRHDLDTIAKLHGLGGKVKKSALINTKDKEQLTDEESSALGAYACDDVSDTYGIFIKLLPHIPDDELRLIDMTMRMFCDPVLEIDIPRVKAELEREVGEKAAAIEKAGVPIEELMSGEKFAKHLEAAGAELPTKISPTTGKEVYAFAKSDLDFQELMKNGNDKVKALCEARLRAKSTIGETRAIRFLNAGQDGAKLPVLLNYSGAHTHRWSGGNRINLQNLKRGGELRRSILAPKGQMIVVADSAQIEARVLAWLAGQDDIVEAFANKQDVYKMMASAIYATPVEQITKDQRFIGKICVLGLGYGMGPQKLQQTLQQGVMGPPVDISEQECRRIVNIYRTKNWCIRHLWTTMDKAIECMTMGVEFKYKMLEFGKGYMRLPNGLFLQYYGLHGTAVQTRGDMILTETSYLTRTGRAKLYGGLLTENIVQALSRNIIANQMLAIDDAGYRIVTMTHDEIVIVCDENKAREALDFMIQTMSTPPKWAEGLPLSAEGGFDTSYSK